ncbi:MAG: acylphosphatase [Candidatus Limnocylindria bacterium]
MRARFVVRGTVQGVYFRAEAAAAARRLGLSGRVWNRADGAVGLVAEGDEAALAELERWLHAGPELAEVRAVERSAGEGEGRYGDFRVSSGPAE